MQARNEQSCFHLQTVTDLLIFLAPTEGPVTTNTSTQQGHPGNAPTATATHYPTGIVCRVQSNLMNISAAVVGDF